MREILFRGKRVDNGEWVEGGTLIQLEVGTYILPTGKNAIITSGNIATLTTNVYKVDKDTISQYTGLTDDNSKRIFDGDVVQNCDEDEGVKNFIVVWHDYDKCFELNDIDTGWEIDINYLSDCEVIGNKWDNAELLEGEHGND